MTIVAIMTITTIVQRSMNSSYANTHRRNNPRGGYHAL